MLKNTSKITVLVFTFGMLSLSLQAEEIKNDNSTITQTPVSGQPVAENTPPVKAEEPMVFVQQVSKPLTEVYKRLFSLLENNGYFIIFEPNIGRNLSHFATRWGKDYNKNKLEEIRSMVFCNGWYANQVSNFDPDMMVLCPLHITLTQREGITKVLFIRPGQVSKYSQANRVATELEQDVIRIIKESSQ